jgi:hypothetical protein
VYRLEMEDLFESEEQFRDLESIVQVLSLSLYCCSVLHSLFPWFIPCMLLINSFKQQLQCVSGTDCRGISFLHRVKCGKMGLLGVEMWIVYTDDQNKYMNVS